MEILKSTDRNSNQESQAAIVNSLARQAEEIKKQEAARLDREKLISLSAEILKKEALNRERLEAELSKAKQEAESTRQSQNLKDANPQKGSKKLFVTPTF